MFPGLIALIGASNSGLGPGPPNVISGVEAVHFDGATYLENDGLISVPPSNRYFFLSYWYRSSVVPSINDPVPIPFTAGSVASVSHQQVSDGTVYLNFSANLNHLPPGPGYGTLAFNGPTLPYDGTWHHIMISVDSVNAVGMHSLDNVVSVASFYTATNLGPMPWSAVTYWGIGGGNSSVLPDHTIGDAYTGDLAELMFLTGTPVDISDPMIRSGLRRPSGKPIRNSMAGTTALGEDIQPQIYCHGDRNTFTKNYKDGGWDIFGNYTDPGLNGFDVFVGTLIDATTDPWGGETAGI